MGLVSNKKRIEIIDFLRAIPILAMLFGHFTQYYHFPDHVEKWLNYVDTQMDLFLFCAGYMVGWAYYPRFLRDPWMASKRLFKRAIQIALIQYLLIFTINLPFYYIMYDKIREQETVWIFLGKSMLFLNQLGIIHILPTFIPMFIVSPLILYLIRRKQILLLSGFSLALFAIGNVHPHMLDFGDKTIFPFISWQIYFVAGCIVGQRGLIEKLPTHGNTKLYPIISILWLVCFLAIRYLKIIPPSFVSPNPLNFGGLLYRSSIIFVIIIFSVHYWPWIRDSFGYKYIVLFGRHALLAFTLHLYWARIVAVVNQFLLTNVWLNYFFILILGPFLIYWALLRYEVSQRPLILKRLFK